jgi:CDP-paratose synthetase
MKIALTGATGFVGGHLIQKLKSLGHELVSIQRSDSNALTRSLARIYVDDGCFETLTQFFKSEKFDGVIHLASHFVSEHAHADVEKLLKSNIQFPSCLLDAAASAGTKWFLSTGTFWQHYKNQSYEPVNLYAASKQAFEDIGRFYHSTERISFCTLKLSDTFGPGDTRNKLPKLLTQVLKESRKLEMSPGEQTLSMLYITDVVDGFVECMNGLQENRLRGSNLNFALAPSETISLKNFVALFSDVAGQPLNIVWGARPYRVREVMAPWSDFIVLPNWRAQVPLRDGLKMLLKAEAHL